MPRPEMRTMAALLTRRAQLASVLLLGCVSLAVAADKTAQQLNDLGDEFLEYLGSLEADDESWMDFAADSAAVKEPKPQTGSNGKVSSDSKVVAGASSSSSSRALPQASMNTSAASKTGKVEK